MFIPVLRRHFSTQQELNDYLDGSPVKPPLLSEGNEPAVIAAIEQALQFWATSARIEKPVVANHYQFFVDPEKIEQHARRYAEQLGLLPFFEQHRDYIVGEICNRMD